MNKKLRVLITVVVILIIALITIDRVANKEVEAQLNRVKLDLQSKGYNITWENSKFRLLGTDLIIKEIEFIGPENLVLRSDKVVIDMIDLQNEIPQFLSVEIFGMESPNNYLNIKP